MPAAWLRYPAKTIGRRPACPTRRPRFRTAELALRSVLSAHHTATTTACQQCGGFHLDTTPRSTR